MKAKNRRGRVVSSPWMRIVARGGLDPPRGMGAVRMPASINSGRCPPSAEGQRFPDVMTGSSSFRKRWHRWLITGRLAPVGAEFRGRDPKSRSKRLLIRRLVGTPRHELGLTRKGHASNKVNQPIAITTPRPVIFKAND